MLAKTLANMQADARNAPPPKEEEEEPLDKKGKKAKAKKADKKKKGSPEKEASPTGRTSPARKGPAAPMIPPMLTFGDNDEYASEARMMVECEVYPTRVTEIVLDSENKFICAPGNSNGIIPARKIFENMKTLVIEFMALFREGARAGKPVSIVQMLEIKEGTKDQFEDVIENYCYVTKQEEGCLRFDVLEDDKDPNLYYTYRVFDKVESVMAHRRTTHYHDWDSFKTDGNCINMNHKQQLNCRDF